ncbi:helix-turn-helix domain-containing protein [Paenibacillus sp. H1-7]|uniref:helix-turn-helix domain-containing protein n=1 Tax=Paenibacillus sp. H1-7 TaxID=2282849 RepID=UPI001EF92016|nr:helix-turn-helix domain-containing protein [Paenibacillus sp. H1-7]ULL18170.1 helix-turn-helix domain-containing protein [Paenibacillus sp. H1-7]
MKPHNDNTISLQRAIYDIQASGKSQAVPECIDEHRALEHQLILYAAKGKGDIFIDGKREQLERESIYVHAPGTKLEIQLSPGSSAMFYWISFDLFILSEKTDSRRGFVLETTFPLQGKIRAFSSQFKRFMYLLISDTKLESDESRRFHRQQLLHNMLNDLLTHATAVNGNDTENRLRVTIEYMQRHYRENIRMSELAELGQFHPSYYSQVFKQTMQKTPMAYLTDLRINKAKEMLLVTDKSISDIAAHVGYGDEFYFSKRFKATSGYSPTVFPGKKKLNIISLSAPYTDHLFTLGHTPRAAQVHRHIPLVTKQLNLPKHGSESWKASRDIFLEEQPDLIVCKDNVLSKAQEHINDIAPIISIPWVNKDVYQHLIDIAELINQQRLAQQWIDEHGKKAEMWRKKLMPIIGQATVALCVCKGHDLRLYGDRNIGHVFYRSLNICPPERIAKEMGKSPAGTVFTWKAIAPDEIRFYESDFLFVAIETESDRQRILHLLRSNPYWTGHPAVRRKSLYFLDWDKWIVYAPYAINQQLDELGHVLAGTISHY